MIFIGFCYALAACFLWGLIFLIPYIITGFNAIETVIGRCLVFGVISLMIFLRQSESKTYSWSIWKGALLFSFIFNYIYYTTVVISVRYSTPALSALIIGMSPVVISLYGIVKEREGSFLHLIAPSLLIVTGLLLINFYNIRDGGFEMDYLLGIAASGVALLAWSWYVVANASFLKRHPEISTVQWSTLLGCTTLFLTLFFAMGYAVYLGPEGIKKFIQPSPELGTYIVGSLLLGIFCSWVGSWLWNSASLRLPVSLAGQITVFETLFGLLFYYIWIRELPLFLEVFGSAFMLLAVALSYRLFSQQNAHQTT